MIEIERKFLVDPHGWPRGQRQIQITQGYMVRTDGLVLRVRQKDDDYYLSVKSRIDISSSYDFEYSIPREDARVMFDHMCVDNLVRKTRHEVSVSGMLWEIDEFHDANEGLVVAEIELGSRDLEFVQPDWLAEEVTADTRYRNASLATTPYSRWCD